MIDYVAAAERMLTRTSFSLFGTGDPIYHISFGPEATGLPQFPRWFIEFNQRNQGLDLVLNHPSKAMQARLHLQRTGVWKGTIAGGAYIELVPETHQEVWRSDFVDPRAYVRSLRGRVRPKKPLYRETVTSRFDWLSLQYNIADTVRKQSSDICVGVLANNITGVEQLHKIIQRLEQQSTPCPIIVFIDNNTSSEAFRNNLISKSTYLAEKSISFVSYTREWGRGRALIDAHRQILGNLKYARSIIISETSDDLSSTYVESILAFAESHKNYTDVGSIHTGTQIPFQVGTFPPFTDISLSRKQWNKISSYLYEFERMFLSAKDYISRPHSGIRQWVRETRADIVRPEKITKSIVSDPRQYAFLRDRYFEQDVPTTVETAFYLGLDVISKVPVHVALSEGVVIGHDNE